MAEQGLAKALKHAEEVTITVRGRRSGREISLPVWFVPEASRVWLLPVQGSRTQWYRNVLANPTLTLRVDDHSFTARVRPVTDPVVVQGVVERFRARYGPGEIAKYYTLLDVAVEVPLPR